MKQLCYTKAPLMGVFLYFLSNSPHCWSALLLLSEDGHHCLSEQVCVLTVTHHPLLKTHTRRRSDYKNIIINKYSDLKNMLTANSGRFFSRFCSPPSSSVAREVRKTLEKTSSCWQAVDTLVISPWYPASEINYRQHTRSRNMFYYNKLIWAIWASLTHFSPILDTLTVKLSMRQSGWASASL